MTASITNPTETAVLLREGERAPSFGGATAADLAIWRETLARLRTITRRSVVDAWFDKVIVHADAGTMAEHHHRVLGRGR